MNPYTASVLLSGVSAGTIITSMSTNWFLAWMGLELNMLAIIPLMSKMHHPRAIEAATKYFLMQAGASAMLLFATTLNAWHTGEWVITMQENVPMLMVTVALMIKLAVSPFHLWLPDIMQAMDLMTCLILSTWQKIAPMMLLLQAGPNLNPTLLMFLGTLSIVVGGWGGLNQPQLRKILAYSSTAHLGWMMIILPHSTYLTMLALFMYMLITLSLFLMMIYLSSTNINKMATSWIKNISLTSLMMVILLSLGGLPPMSGFIPKWLILEEVIKHNMILLATIMAVSTLLSLFFYLRLSYTTSLTTPPTPMNSKPMWRLKTKQNQISSTMIILSVLLIPLVPAIGL
uniref:NADH-ubiquinone oxidoreductase chain 2 n=1 Tax=Bolitoglossa n. sp. RLM-2004 TaxID=291262 RepID=Q644B2_9SALA|nr:NADH dehydrogenase subunit 2 [Bolitoglossa n. sp. RLM-2004]AAU20722.1 NADH dehydrogenase subunit 2 [Bolitoglossa n. sp. RLM-2004]